jgi:hypothetical protein
MHVRAAILVAMLAALAGLATACSGASYAERMAYLGKMASEGLQTHRLIVSQGGTTTAKRCTDAYSALQDQNVPDDSGVGSPSQEWIDQIQAFFVESCVTGLPKPVPGQPASPSTSSPQPSGTPSGSSAHPTTTPSSAH